MGRSIKYIKEVSAKSYKLLMNSILVAGLVCFQWNHAEAASITIDFDHLASPPAVTGAGGFFM